MNVKAIFLAGLVAFFNLADPISAATVKAVFGGIVNNSSIGPGTTAFGFSGDDDPSALDGQIFAYTIVFDTALGTSISGPAGGIVALFSGSDAGDQNPVLSSRLTINGVTKITRGLSQSAIFQLPGFLFSYGTLDQSSTVPGEESFIVLRQILVENSGGLTAMIPADIEAPFEFESGAASELMGAFIFETLTREGVFLESVRGELTVTSARVGIPVSSVPLPSSFPMLLIAVGVLCVFHRNRRMERRDSL